MFALMVAATPNDPNEVLSWLGRMPVALRAERTDAVMASPSGCA